MRDVALALDEMGVAAGDRVAVFADNEPRWLYADLGIQALGAASVGIYPALDPADGRVRDRALRRAHRLLRRPGAGRQAPGAAGATRPGSSSMIVFDVKGLHTPEYADTPLETFDEFAARGRALDAESPGPVRASS